MGTEIWTLPWVAPERAHGGQGPRACPSGGISSPTLASFLLNLLLAPFATLSCSLCLCPSQAVPYGGIRAGSWVPLVIHISSWASWTWHCPVSSCQAAQPLPPTSALLQVPRKNQSCSQIRGKGPRCTAEHTSAPCKTPGEAAGPPKPK